MKKPYKETGLTDETITDDLGIETIQNYIRIRRAVAAEKYDVLNDDFADKYSVMV